MVRCPPVCGDVDIKWAKNGERERIIACNLYIFCKTCCQIDQRSGFSLSLFSSLPNTHEHCVRVVLKMGIYVRIGAKHNSRLHSHQSEIRREIDGAQSPRYAIDRAKVW